MYESVVVCDEGDNYGQQQERRKQVPAEYQEEPHTTYVCEEKEERQEWVMSWAAAATVAKDKF